MPALVAGIHVLTLQQRMWMAGTSPAMTSLWIDTFAYTYTSCAAASPAASFAAATISNISAP
jgi:hypothetical protein